LRRGRQLQATGAIPSRSRAHLGEVALATQPRRARSLGAPGAGAPSGYPLPAAKLAHSIHAT
ncbi:MAG: hypothetical protein OXD30_02880, partial [Bryobacterales bacterium]|nr:hypothetical protein [Bryobacterales bacterium]